MLMIPCMHWNPIYIFSSVWICICICLILCTFSLQYRCVYVSNLPVYALKSCECIPYPMYVMRIHVCSKLYECSGPMYMLSTFVCFPCSTDVYVYAVDPTSQAVVRAAQLRQALRNRRVRLKSLLPGGLALKGIRLPPGPRQGYILQVLTVAY